MDSLNDLLAKVGQGSGSMYIATRTLGAPETFLKLQMDMLISFVSVYGISAPISFDGNSLSQRTAVAINKIFTNWKEDVEERLAARPLFERTQGIHNTQHCVQNLQKVHLVWGSNLAIPKVEAFPPAFRSSSFTRDREEFTALLRILPFEVQGVFEKNKKNLKKPTKVRRGREESISGGLPEVGRGCGSS